MNKPEIKHVSFSRREGKFNWLNSDQISAQYIFKFPHLTREEIKKMELGISYLVNIEKDYDLDPKSYTALEAAYEIAEIYKDYLFHSDKGKIEKLIEYLESIEEEQDELRHKYEIDNAHYQINYWENKLKNLQKQVQ